MTELGRATKKMSDPHEKCRQQVLEEHAALTRDIQVSTGCSAIDARFQAWLILFERELVPMAAQ